MGSKTRAPRAPHEHWIGVIIDRAKGYVLTTITSSRAREVMVTLKDRRQFQAKLVGSDAGTDIALLKIDAQNIAALRFGDSEALNVGGYVLGSASAKSGAPALA